MIRESSSSQMNQNPLEIPEVRRLVASHLGKKSLVACARVCKTWYQDFYPHVWHNLSVPYTKSPDSLAAWREGVKKNAHWIRHIADGYSLHEIAKLEGYLLAHCRSLVSIVVPNEANADTWISLIKLNPGLEIVQAKALSQDVSDRFAQALEGLGQLHTLSMGRLNLSTLLRILTACASLRVLTVCPVSDKSPDEQGDKDHTDAPARTFGLHRVTIEMCTDQSAVDELLPRFPEMKSLDFASSGDYMTIDLAKVFREGQFPQLTELKLHTWGDYKELMQVIPPRQLSHVYLAMEAKKGLHQLLERQGETLEVLELYECRDYDELPQVFYQCPRLRKLDVENFRDGFVEVADLLREPWVCKDLEYLKLPIGVMSSSWERVAPELEMAMVENRKRRTRKPLSKLAENLFVDRISKLRKLKQIDLILDEKWCALSRETRRTVGCLTLEYEDDS